MDVRADSFDFPPGTGQRVVRRSYEYSFDQRIASAHVALAGYHAEYSDGDHHVQQIEASVATAPVITGPDGYEVPVVATLNLRDDNGDDSFFGSIDFVLFVDFQFSRGLPDRPTLPDRPAIS